MLASTPVLVFDDDFLRPTRPFTRNLIPNPSGETGSTTGHQSNTTVVTDANAIAGTKMFQLTGSISVGNITGAVTVGKSATGSGTGGVPCSPGDIFSARVRMKATCSVAMTTISARFYWYDSGGTQIGTTTFQSISSPVDGQVYDLSGNGIAPANAAFVAIRPQFSITSSGSTQTYTITYDGVLLVKDVLVAPAYFDGDNVLADWEGTAHASESQSYSEDGLADYGWSVKTTNNRMYVGAKGYLLNDGNNFNFQGVSPASASSDFKIVQKIVVGSGPSSARQIETMLKYIDANNVLRLKLNVSTIPSVTLQVFKMDEGVSSVLATSPSYTPSLGQTIWFVAYVIGNVVTGETWLTDPALGGSPARSVNYTLTGADATKFGAGVIAQPGLQCNIGTIDWMIDEYMVYEYTQPYSLVDNVDPFELVSRYDVGRQDIVFGEQNVYFTADEVTKLRAAGANIQSGAVAPLKAIPWWRYRRQADDSVLAGAP